MNVLKLYKHGYSKVTDHASREIRFGRITRDQGLALVKKHELEEIEHMELFCEWLGRKTKSHEFFNEQA